MDEERQLRQSKRVLGEQPFDVDPSQLGVTARRELRLLHAKSFMGGRAEYDVVPEKQWRLDVADAEDDCIPDNNVDPADDDSFVRYGMEQALYRTLLQFTIWTGISHCCEHWKSYCYGS